MTAVMCILDFKKKFYLTGSQCKYVLLDPIMSILKSYKIIFYKTIFEPLFFLFTYSIHCIYNYTETQCLLKSTIRHSLTLTLSLSLSLSLSQIK